MAGWHSRPGHFQLFQFLGTLLPGLGQHIFCLGIALVIAAGNRPSVIPLAHYAVTE